MDKCKSKIWEYFIAMSKIPRCSGHLDGIRQHLKQAASSIDNVEVFKDDIGNLLLRKPATAGYEHFDGICIQGHMDMVTTKVDDMEFDFMTESINLEFEGDWLSAKGTTLGADNGIGVAAGLALMKELEEHPLLECLFTVDEETTMAGAEYLQANWLQSKILINCDSEEEESICMGCAGGQENKYTMDLHRISVSGTAIQLHLNGLRGGHSGCSIHEGVGNAAKLMNRILLSGNMDEAYLKNYTAGNAVNAIPSYAHATVVVPNDKIEMFENQYNQAFREICMEYANIEGVYHESKNSNDCNYNLEIKKANVEQVSVVDHTKSAAILGLIAIIPDGVLRYSPDVQGLVESSTSLSLIELSDSEFMTHTFTRSSRESALKYYAQQVDAICTATGAKNSGLINVFPGWQPNIHSKTLQAAKIAHEKLFNTSPRVYSIHAGLETGLIQKIYPNMDCISIGPLIENAHSTQERMLIPSVDRFYSFLVEIIHQLYKKQNN